MEWLSTRTALALAAAVTLGAAMLRAWCLWHAHGLGSSDQGRHPNQPAWAIS